VQDEFATYVAFHSTCSTVDDCTREGWVGTCNCTSTLLLGSGSGTGIRKDAVSGLKPYYDVAARCSGAGICDAAPGELACDHGQCVVHQRSCLDFDSGAPPDTSIDSSPEVAVETATDAALTCDSVQSEFAAYRAAHDACSSDDECTSIGGAGSCECSRSLGDGSGNGIRKDAVDGAKKYSDFFYASCSTPAVCDARPGAVHCTSGHCTVSWASCLPLPPVDGGPG
jgi:hypothetical protein